MTTTPQTLTLRPLHGDPRRIRIEPADATVDAEAWLVEEEWAGCSWRTVGREPLAEATLE